MNESYKFHPHHMEGGKNFTMRTKDKTHIQYKKKKDTPRTLSI